MPIIKIQSRSNGILSEEREIKLIKEVPQVEEVVKDEYKDNSEKEQGKPTPKKNRRAKKAKQAKG